MRRWTLWVIFAAVVLLPTTSISASWWRGRTNNYYYPRSYGVRSYVAPRAYNQSYYGYGRYYGNRPYNGNGRYYGNRAYYSPYYQRGVTFYPGGGLRWNW